ncbi:hypothetical protein [Kerstersia sp.]|uniref:hypothetical protein n=1 Tax=Kerstersia sp. TaxID=1930783 RepID=UPI003F9243A0
MTNASIHTLQDLTNRFFQRHWPTDAAAAAPRWTMWEPFLSAPCPNYNRNGCYALLGGKQILYIGAGMAAGRPGDRYENHGISTRLKHVFLADRNRPNWHKLKDLWRDRGVDGAYTLGFDECQYLALALEHYLITHLRPALNKNYKPR